MDQFSILDNNNVVMTIPIPTKIRELKFQLMKILDRIIHTEIPLTAKKRVTNDMNRAKYK